MSPDVFDLQRLMVERVRAAGFTVRRVAWNPGDGMSIAFAVSGNHTAWIDIDEEMVIPLALNRASLIEWMDREIAGHKPGSAA